MMTDISGPLAHQMPLHNHRGGLVQPSLVMNHHLDMECHGADIRISKYLVIHFICCCCPIYSFIIIFLSSQNLLHRIGKSHCVSIAISTHSLRSQSVITFQIGKWSIAHDMLVCINIKTEVVCARVIVTKRERQR